MYLILLVNFVLWYKILVWKYFFNDSFLILGMENLYFLEGSNCGKLSFFEWLLLWKFKGCLFFLGV